MVKVFALVFSFLTIAAAYYTYMDRGYAKVSYEDKSIRTGSGGGSGGGYTYGK